MTREEAIERILQDIKANGKYLSKEYKEALNMAIRSLEAWDLIRRKLNELQEPSDMGFGEESVLITIRIDKMKEIIDKCLSEVTKNEIL